MVIDIMEDMYFCEWKRGIEKRLNFSGEIGVFQERREDKYCVIAALHTDTSYRILAGGTHYGLLGEDGDWSTLDAAVEHIVIKADDMRRKLLVSGLANARDADGAKFAIVCFRPLRPRERADAFRFLGRLSVDLSVYFGKHMLVAGDVGTKPVDLSFAALSSPAAFDHVAGQSPEYGGVGDTGLPTALGAMEAIELVYRIYGNGKSWARTMAVQGLGSVGGSLVREAVKREWDVAVADTNPKKVSELQASLPHPARVVDSSVIYTEPVTIFAPCAVHPIITKKTTGEFRCKMIISVQNTDIDRACAHELLTALHQRGIPVALGPWINSMGIAMLLRQGDLKQLPYHMILEQELIRHHLNVSQMMTRAHDQNVPMYVIAEEMMERAIT